MTTPSDEPLQKCTFNLFAADIAYMEKTHGWGWSEVLRNLLRTYVRERKAKLTGEGLD